MSDFQVGDVVRCSQGTCPCDHEDETITGVTPWGVKISDGSVCRPQFLALVSRPSEAKPAFKVGDKVRILKSGREEEISVVLLNGDVGTRRMPGVYMTPNCVELILPEPALKVEVLESIYDNAVSRYLGIPLRERQRVGYKFLAKCSAGTYAKDFEKRYKRYIDQVNAGDMKVNPPPYERLDGGIAAKIPTRPLHTRLQTSSWDPVDDTFLEDVP